MAQIACQNCGAPIDAKRSDAKWCIVCRVIKDREKLARYEQRNRGTCLDCGISIVRRSQYCQSCGNKHAGEHRQGDSNSHWKGGVTTAYGYRYVRKPYEETKGREKPGAGDYYPEHQMAWESSNGRPLPKGWVVHHVNGIRDDNRPDNLVAMPRGQHQKIHGELRQAHKAPPYRTKSRRSSP